MSAADQKLIDQSYLSAGRESDQRRPTDELMDFQLETLLRSLKGEHIVYVPNGGNAGDSFIAQATYQFFEQIGLEYEIGNQSEQYSDRVIVFGGGGNLVTPYNNGIAFLRRNLGHWKQLIILPHTIRAYEDVLAQFEANCYVFCREKASYEFVRRHAASASVFLSHDLAISCDFSTTRRQMRERWMPDLFNRTLFIRDLKRLLRIVHHTLRVVGRTNELNAFRTDIEKTVLSLPSGNFDISQGFAADDMLPSSSLHATYWMMAFIDRFSVVRTNRLHVAIMAAMLGKELHLYDNSYGKVRDVFVHSLRARFPNVRWEGSADPADGSILRRT
jgi:exopolysaccharide biosynthesis predicted pyruvyltransferase EpsI